MLEEIRLRAFFTEVGRAAGGLDGGEEELGVDGADEGGVGGLLGADFGGGEAAAVIDLFLPRCANY